MVITINYKFTPFRLVMKRREPVHRSVDIANKDNAPAKLSVKLVISRQLSLDKGGIKTAALERVDALATGETKTFHYEISAKHSTVAGEHPIKIIVDEHYRDYTYLKKENIVDVGLIVE